MTARKPVPPACPTLAYVAEMARRARAASIAGSLIERRGCLCAFCNLSRKLTLHSLTMTRPLSTVGSRPRSQRTASPRPVAVGKAGGKEVSWERLVQWHPPSHLITGEHEHDRLNRVKLLRRLIIALRMKRDWAVRVSRDRGRTLVQVALEDENDALRLTEVLGARPVRRYVGWETQQEFEFDPDLAERLRKALMLT